MKSGEILAAKYRLEKRLGVGGMGDVWKATHTGTGREFAVKIMHAHAAASPTARERFAREAKASSKINHPSVIDVFDVGETEDGLLFLAMELLDGLTLDDLLHGDTPITASDFLTIMLDTARALAAAHAVGFVHRDIKPANIFLHRDRASGLYAAKVLDFGISKDNSSSATRTGAVVGSPRYMSPEQTRSAANVDARSDLWSLGVVLFEGLTGAFPHDGDSFSSLVVSICTAPPMSIDSVAPRLPESVRSIIRDCLKPLPERIAGAENVAARIEIALADPTLAQMPLPRPVFAMNEPPRTVPGLRLRPATLSRSSAIPAGVGPASTARPYPAAPPPSTSGGSGMYPIASPPSTSGTYPAPNPISLSTSAEFVPTAQTLPLSAVQQLQEQMKEHLEANSRRRGGTLALPMSDPLVRTVSGAASPQAQQPAPQQPVSAQTMPKPAPFASPQTLSNPGAASAPASPIATTQPDLDLAAAADSSGKRLRLLAIVLAVVLIGIVIALVSTVRSS